MTTLLIDGDHLLYQATAAVEREVRWDEDNHVLFSNADEAYGAFTGILKRVTRPFPGATLYFAFTGTENFRKSLFPPYKASRDRKPLCYWRLLELIGETYTMRRYPQLEADDVMGIWATSGKIKDPIIVSEDKDLQTIPGKLYRRGEVVTVTPEDADRFWMTQTLTGDTTDGYPGLPGVGEKGAEKLLSGKVTLEEMWGAVVGAYEAKGLTKEDALIQARCARILRVEDWNTEKKEVMLWEPMERS